MRFSHLVSADLTDTGRVRTNNEDAAVRLPESGLFCVADGMGGAAEGELASRTIIDALEEAFSGRHSDGEPDFERTKELIREAALNANAWIHEHAEDQGSGGMGSTVVMLAFDPDDPRRATVMHAGDSRAYRLRGDTLTRLMKDHSLVSEAGLDDRASLGPMFSSMVTRAVGIRTAFELEEAAADVLANDLFLLCSDGLTTMVPDADLLRCLCENRERDAAEICRMLVDESNQRGGEDNITVVIIKVGFLPEPDALNAVAHKVDAVVEVQPADEEPQVEAPEELGGLEERNTTPFSDSSEEPDAGRNDRSVSTDDLECETPAAVKIEKTTEPIVLPRAKPERTIPAPPPVREPSASLLWLGAAAFGLLVVVVVWLLIVPSGTRRKQPPAVKVIGPPGLMEARKPSSDKSIAPGTAVRLSDSDISNVRATLPARMDGTLLTGEWGAMSGYVSKWTPAIPDLLASSDRGALYASWTGLWKQMRDGKVDAMVVCRQYREEVTALCRKAGFTLPAVEAEPPATGSAEFRADAACRIMYGLQK
ncbi:MAG: protein phosphatase 2C domain-containing protein, partial [bacterium]